jgi:hypothetical protein
MGSAFCSEPGVACYFCRRMSAFGWRDAAWAAGVAVAAVAAFFIFRTPEPARTGLDLVALVCTRSAERAAALERHVAEPLELVVPPEDALDEDRAMSRAALANELTRLDVFHPGCSFSLEDWAIRPGSPGTAWLEGTLEYSDSQPSDLHGQRRPLRALFRDAGEVWRLERVVLGRVERTLPEARP